MFNKPLEPGTIIASLRERSPEEIIREAFLRLGVLKGTDKGAILAHKQASTEIEWQKNILGMLGGVALLKLGRAKQYEEEALIRTLFKNAEDACLQDQAIIDYWRDKKEKADLEGMDAFKEFMDSDAIFKKTVQAVLENAIQAQLLMEIGVAITTLVKQEGYWGEKVEQIDAFLKEFDIPSFKVEMEAFTKELQGFQGELKSFAEEERLSAQLINEMIVEHPEVSQELREMQQDDLTIAAGFESMGQRLAKIEQSLSGKIQEIEGEIASLGRYRELFEKKQIQAASLNERFGESSPEQIQALLASLEGQDLDTLKESLEGGALLLEGAESNPLSRLSAIKNQILSDKKNALEIQKSLTPLMVRQKDIKRQISEFIKSKPIDVSKFKILMGQKKTIAKELLGKIQELQPLSPQAPGMLSAYGQARNPEPAQSSEPAPAQNKSDLHRRGPRN